MTTPKTKKPRPDDLDRSTIPSVGSTLWVRRQEVREYAKDARGFDVGSALELPKWQKFYVVGETSKSLLLSRERSGKSDYMDYKLAKELFCNGKTPSGHARDEAHRDAIIWANSEGWLVKEAVGRVTDPILLAKIALLAGYKAGEGRAPMPTSLLAAAIKPV